MTEFTPLAGALGGMLIGLSAVVLMGGIGRVAGLSNIFGGVLTTQWSDDLGWRALFLLGLLAGAAITALIGGIDVDTISFSGGTSPTVIGGLLVGVGTLLGAGCTSGHGICGISRLSPRSIVSTLIFMSVAVATVFVTRHVMGG